jgi:arsenate reductase (glutaredoxin)
MSLTMYGIPNCDTIKKARTWLTAHEVEFVFHDYKKQGVTAVLLTAWIKQATWQRVLNTAGLSFKKLDAADKETLTEAKAIKLMLENPSMIKRPILTDGRMLLVGFKPEEYEKQFA